MPVNNDGLSYSTIEGFSQWISENFAGMLSDDTPNSYDATVDSSREVIKKALLYAEGRIDGFLKIRGYSTPIDSSYTRSHSVLFIYTCNIAVFELYGRRGLTKERYYKYEQIMRELKNISKGYEFLPDDIPLSSKSKPKVGASMQSVFASTDRSYANNI